MSHQKEGAAADIINVLVNEENGEQILFKVHKKTKFAKVGHSILYYREM